MVNASDAVTLAKSYDPYGVARSNAQLIASPYGYTGEFTESTGMVYLRARHYNPSQGRFMSRDTWAGDANNPMSFNRWNYTSSNPMNFTDPTGHSACPSGDTDCITYVNINGTTMCVGKDGQIHPVTQSSDVELYIPEAIGADLWVLKLKREELLARIIFGEEYAKLFTDKEGDAWGVAWAIRNRYESSYSDLYVKKWPTGDDTHELGEYRFYYSAVSMNFSNSTLRVHDPLNAFGWMPDSQVIKLYNRAMQIAKLVLAAPKEYDITHGAIGWADKANPLNDKSNYELKNEKTTYGTNPDCPKCITYKRTHFHTAGYEPHPEYDSARDSFWCVEGVPLSECND